MPTVTPQGHGLGWRPQLPDFRDYRLSPTVEPTLPASVDLSPKMPPVVDQGELGSCTANATAACIQYDRETADLTPDFAPSRLFLYYETRRIEGSVRYDSGATIRDTVKAASKYGTPPEPEWPYDITRFKKAPSAKAKRDAARYRVTGYLAVDQTEAGVRGCLASGWPVVFGFTVYRNFYSPAGDPETVIPMPSGSVLGGHAVVIVGYDDDTRRFKVRNSWGPDVQDHGHFYMPYEYALNPSLASDFWTVRATAGAAA